ncbi:uncharacterized protein SPAPADRAFT_51192 [Spathaspora passalidarum NRRL Y-27907]|uniref:Ubiquitin carboxyl-terminal hydrolase n=1 Tax=Spathaspora passalidarum (strain NRRL Y-27907 / 11-Y1) TaxID=619300 RepID=G3AP86_SPAPN|nr:uncharacterized protein SPAPADRAFT_51192 [Spathaspora passalidarum NRRL Y-27907]EGW32657.1 hypothetical protein SPAPADRAFT_51192 [Spathaspora passalidarum NRRL Y-27907]
MKTIAELKSISSNLVKDTIGHAKGFSQLTNAQITLLQIFNHQIKNLSRIGYCDYEVTYVVYLTASQLLSMTKRFVNDKNREIFEQIETALANKKQQFGEVETFISNQVLTPTGGADPLLHRFMELQGKPETHMNGNSLTHFKYRDQITPQELHELFNSKSRVLLIDYRPKKDFLHNHINYEDIVLVQPKQVQSLTSEDTDLELEQILKDSLPSDQFDKFQNRHKYDLIVVYDFKYGGDRFSNLADEQPNPFLEFIDILMFRNKYISSRPKILPCYLAGGILNWHKQFGDESIARSPVENGNKREENHKSDNYLTSFGDYISTNKEVKNEPVPYIKPMHRRNGNQYVPEPVKIVPKPEPVFPPTPRSRESTPTHTAPAIPITAPTHTTATTAVTAPLPQQQFSQSEPSRPPALPAKIPTVQGMVPYTPPALPEKPPAYSIQQVPASSSPVPAKKSDFLDSYTTGLVNLGNSCYMNCVLQCLGATPQLTTFFFPSSSDLSNPQFKQHINTNNKLGSKGILTVQFAELLSNMFSSNGKVFNPSKFKKIMGSLSPSRQFATYDQQDCIEFLIFLLDTLHEDLNQMAILDPQEKKMISELTPEQEKSRETLPIRLASTIEWERYLKLNFSVIVDYFQGQLLSQLKCLECGFTSTTYNSFSILSLPIPEKLNKSTKVSLQDCLEEFTTIELLDDNNKWHCPKCKRFTKSTKKIAITRLPQVLIINFTRFKMTPDGRFNKLETFVTYPVSEELDLTKYWPDVGTSINPSLPSVMSVDKEREMLKTFPVRNQVPPFKYQLFGVANHFGNLTTGHYTSYVKKHGRGWCYFDDSKITYKCSTDKVLNKNAYCLFFQRV